MGYILLVEDNLDTAAMITRTLNTASLEVRHCVKGLEAAKIARRHHPDLILMDFDLPDIDGRSMVLLLKKQLGGDQAPPIIAVTARSGQSEEYIAKRMGCDAFVSKPFEPEALLALVLRMLNRASS